MKTITITYDAQEIEDGQKFIGETCIDITLLDEVADRLIQTGESGTATLHRRGTTYRIRKRHGNHQDTGKSASTRERAEK